VAARFGVSVASAVKVAAVSSDRPAAVKMGGGRPLRLKSERDWLLAPIAEKPDLTLRAVVAELAERGTRPATARVALFRPREDYL
jgi:transposase